MALFPDQIQISDFQSDEIISPSAIYVKTDALRLAVPLNLLERRIFLYLEVKQSVFGNYFFDCEVTLSRGARIRGRFPARIAEIASASDVNQSVVSLLNAGGSPVGDSLVIRLAQPFDPAIPSVVVQPLRVNAEVDLITLNITGKSGATLTGFRAYLGCLSTKY